MALIVPRRYFWLLLFLGDTSSSYRSKAILLALIVPRRYFRLLPFQGDTSGSYRSKAILLALIVPRRYRSFQCNTSVVVLIVLCFGVEYLCCLYHMNVFIFSQVRASEWPRVGK